MKTLFSLMLSFCSLTGLSASIPWDVSCNAADEFRLTLQPSSTSGFKPSLTSESFGFSSPDFLVFAEPRPSLRNVMIKGCYNATTEAVTLIQFAVNISTAADIKRFDASNSEIRFATGLSETLFGEATLLNLIIQPHKGGQFRLKGWNLDGVSFVTLDYSEDARIYYDVVFGEIKQGDGFSNPIECQNSVTGASGIFRILEKEIGSAKFISEVCAYNSGGRSSRYEYLAVEVTDTVALSPGEIPQLHTVRLTDLSGILLHRESHHNWCDNFYLKVPTFGAEYAEIYWDKPIEGYPIVPGKIATRYEGGEWILDTRMHPSLPCY